MRTNQRMQGYLADWKSDESTLSPELSRILNSGFVEENGCVFLASEAHNSADTRHGELDDTGLECFVNHLHVKSLAEAVQFARRLESALTERFTDSFAVVVSFDGRDATVRFHKRRAGEAWVNDNLEGYLDEGIAVFD